MNMISPRHEFETIPAFTTLAGSTYGTATARDTTAYLIKTLHIISKVDVSNYWRDLAEMNDDDTQDMWDMQSILADEINDHANLPESCSVQLQDGEWIVLPYIDDEIEKFVELPDTYVNDTIYTVTDHGNITCWSWINDSYVEQWSMV